MALLLAITVAVAIPARADEAPVPASCKLHPTAIVNPGCARAVKGGLDAPRTLPGIAPDIHDLFVNRAPVVDPVTGAVVEGSPVLFFDTRTHNVGVVPLDLKLDDFTDPANSTVSQCLTWSVDLVCRARQVVEGFAWDPAVADFHFTEYTTTELRRLGADGRPDYSEAGLIAAVDRPLPCFNDAAKVGDGGSQVPFYKSCSPLRQGITPGWTASFDPRHEVDQLSLDGLTDGLYGLVVYLDYNEHLHDLDRADNVQEVVVELYDGVHQARAVSRSYPGVPAT